MSLIDIVWILVFISFLTPAIQRRLLESARFRQIRKLEKNRQARVITMIHRQERMSLLGIPISRFIDIEDSEQILRAIHLTPDDVPLDLIIHTPGGLVLAAEQIAHALTRHPAKVTVFVPHYAMSGGTVIALAADEIVMDENAVLGPVDPQLAEFPAASLIEVTKIKPIGEIDDRTLILADIAKKAVNQVRDLLKEITMANGMPEDKATKIADTLSSGRWTHDYPIRVEQAKELGLPVTDQMPPEIYALMDLYRQPGQGRPSVQYIPVPYRREVPRPDERRER